MTTPGQSSGNFEMALLRSNIEIWEAHYSLARKAALELLDHWGLGKHRVSRDVVAAWIDYGMAKEAFLRSSGDPDRMDARAAQYFTRAYTAFQRKSLRFEEKLKHACTAGWGEARKRADIAVRATQDFKEKILAVQTICTTGGIVAGLAISAAGLGLPALIVGIAGSFGVLGLTHITAARLANKMLEDPRRIVELASVRPADKTSKGGEAKKRSFDLAAEPTIANTAGIVGHASAAASFTGALADMTSSLPGPGPLLGLAAAAYQSADATMQRDVGVNPATLRTMKYLRDGGSLYAPGDIQPVGAQLGPHEIVRINDGDHGLLTSGGRIVSGADFRGFALRYASERFFERLAQHNHRFPSDGMTIQVTDVPQSRIAPRDVGSLLFDAYAEVTCWPLEEVWSGMHFSACCTITFDKDGNPFDSSGRLNAVAPRIPVGHPTEFEGDMRLWLLVRHAINSGHIANADITKHVDWNELEHILDVDQRETLMRILDGHYVVPQEWFDWASRWYELA